MTFEITPNIAMEIIGHEAIVRQAYKDSIGTWTWSVGLTSAAGHKVERYIGNPQPLERCLEVYLWALDNYADDVRALFKERDLTEAQFGAALSFHWNTGALLTASWVAPFKAGDMADAERRFMFWNKPPEIVPRRRAEADLLFRGVWSNDGKATEYTRLKPNHTPDWSSAIRIDVRDIIEAKLNGSNTGEAAQPEKPEGEDWRRSALALIHEARSHLNQLETMFEEKT